MIPMSSSAPPIETRTFTFFACAAAASVFTSESDAPKLQLLPLTVPNAKLRCVILLKSILVAQSAKLPFQFGKYMTTFVSGIMVLVAPPLPAAPTVLPDDPPLPAPPPETPPAPSVLVPPAPAPAAALLAPAFAAP